MLRLETIGGLLLVIAAALALVLANSPWAGGYHALQTAHFGPGSLGLDLTLQQWTSDGLLAIFFFLAGLELKREFTLGELSDPRRAVVPVAAAVGGMVVPAGIYLWINATEGGALHGWAIPTATDIAFALAVLAVVGRHLPSALRTFLLTLAIVDDLLAIVIIALFYTRALRWDLLLGSLLLIAILTVVLQRTRGRRVGWRLLLLVLAAGAWALMHASGVHATVAGVLIGFAIPVLGRRRADGTRGPSPRVATVLDWWLRPLSAGVAVPLFAFFSAGVTIGGIGGMVEAWRSPVVVGVVAGLVVGKAVGILVATVSVSWLVRSDLLRRLAVADIAALGVLGGVGFTVSLLIGELAFAPGDPAGEYVELAVLMGSTIAAVVGGAMLAVRGRRYLQRARRRAAEPTPG